MHDVMPPECAYLSYIETVFKNVLESFSYEEIRIPIIESEELFARSVGENTDVVGKEMYSFKDRDGSQLALRPEGTASVARAVINNNLCYVNKPRLWYEGPMFRHERPQAGRYRQFQQIGAEAFGYDEPEIDVELIRIGTEIFKQLGILDSLTLKINTIGTPAARAEYRETLADALTPLKPLLDEDSQRRLKTNPLRIFDSKVGTTQELLKEMPLLRESLSPYSRKRFITVMSRLDELGIKYEVDPRLVRGLDYYTDTVFEWQSDQLGAQSTVCAGGRYDYLVQLLGGERTPGVGFAAGIERIAILVSKQQNLDYHAADVYVVTMDDKQIPYANQIVAKIRSKTELRVREHLGAGTMRYRMKSADRSGSDWALVIGDNEMNDQTVTVKWLRSEEKKQVTRPWVEVIDLLQY